MQRGFEPVIGARGAHEPKDGIDDAEGDAGCGWEGFGLYEGAEEVGAGEGEETAADGGEKIGGRGRDCGYRIDGHGADVPGSRKVQALFEHVDALG